MKRQHFLTLLLASFFIMMAFHGAHTYAQEKSISGDGVCGSSVGTECKLSNLKDVSQGMFKLIITLGLPLLVVFIIFRFVMAWYSLQQGNANAYREALKKVWEALVGFVIIVALFGGIFLAILKYFNVNAGPLKLLQMISSAFIPHAYAADLLPNPTGFTSLYDFILGALSVVMKFFLYPALIGIWVWAGLLYVMAQGAPEKLKKAHNLLMWAFISTLLVFITNGFLVALKGSVDNILK